MRTKPSSIKESSENQSLYDKDLYINFPISEGGKHAGNGGVANNSFYLKENLCLELSDIPNTL